MKSALVMLLPVLVIAAFMALSVFERWTKTAYPEPCVCADGGVP